MHAETDELVHQVRAKMEAVDAASGQKAMALRANLSAYIVEQTKSLMNRGISMQEIQDALQAAAGSVEQTYAPDADASDEDCGERLEPPISVFTFFLPVEEAVITALAAGNLDGADLMEHIRAAAARTPLEMTDGLELVLSDFGKNRALSAVITGGEIVVESTGEAFMPEYITVKEADGYQFSVCEPAVFKSPREVQSIAALLESFDQKTFFKKARIKKLLKSGWLNGYDPRAVKKEARYIIDELWQECTALSEIYRRAREQRKGMLIFSGYRGAETGDAEDDV